MRTLLRFLLAPTALAFLACGTGEGDSQQLDPTLSSIQSNIFSMRCHACHNEQSRDGNLDLSSDGVHDRLVGVKATADPEWTLVTPGEPEKSFLYVKITNPGQGQGDLMPPGFQLPQSEVDTIEQWITEGAENN